MLKLLDPGCVPRHDVLAMTKPAANIPASVHVTTDRLFARVNIGNYQICFENNGAKLEPGAFSAVVAFERDADADTQFALADIPEQIQTAAVQALRAELARIIDIAKPRKLTFAQVQRIYGRAVD